MAYYKLQTWAVRDPAFCLLQGYPSGMDLSSWRLTSGEPMPHDKYPPDAFMVMSNLYPGMQVPDLVANSSNLLVVSPRLKESIEAVNKGPVEFHPLRILNHRERLASKHFIVSPLGKLDVLDLKASKIEWLEGDVVDVETMVLDKKKLKNLPDLFRVREDPKEYIVSDAMLAAWRVIKPKPTNVSFVFLDEKG